MLGLAVSCFHLEEDASLGHSETVSVEARHSAGFQSDGFVALVD